MITQINNFINNPVNTNYKSILKGSIGVAGFVSTATFVMNREAWACNILERSNPLKSMLICCVKTAPYSVATGLATFTILGLVSCIGLKAVGMCIGTEEETPNVAQPQKINSRHSKTI
jgi:hypothetical protein